MRILFALVLLLGLSSGCSLMDDLIDGSDLAPQNAASPPGGACSQPIVNVNARQTQEPELAR